jgi:hypothetical protein
MCDPFRHLHMPPELACQFLAVFSRMEYALKATSEYATGEDEVMPNWDVFANQIDPAFCQVQDESFRHAVNFILAHPPRKQIRDKAGVVQFVDRPPDGGAPKANQTLLMVRRVRNNLFHGGKHLPGGEQEPGRNEQLVSSSLTILRGCVALDERVRLRFDA